MKENTIAIIEIGSNNTKTHIYENEKNIYDVTTTIEFKKNYSINKKIDKKDIQKLEKEIEKAAEYTEKIYVYGCSIFRNISEEELEEINNHLYKKYNLKVSVVSQEEEAALTAYGCYSDNDYDRNICVFIGGGGSTELLIINNKKIIEKKYLDFGVVDITKKFSSLKEDVPSCSLNEVRSYINSIIGEIKKASPSRGIIKKDFNPDYVLFVERWSLYIGQEVSNFFEVPLLGVSASRKKSKLKKVVSTLLIIIPSFIKKKLRDGKEILSRRVVICVERLSMPNYYLCRAIICVG